MDMYQAKNAAFPAIQIKSDNVEVIMAWHKALKSQISRGELCVYSNVIVLETGASQLIPEIDEWIVVRKGIINVVSNGAFENFYEKTESVSN